MTCMGNYAFSRKLASCMGLPRKVLSSQTLVHLMKRSLLCRDPVQPLPQTSPPVLLLPMTTQMADEQISHTTQSLHLSQNIVDVEAFADVRMFLATAAFNKSVEGLQKCKDDGLPKACAGLINKLGFRDKIKNMKYNVVRIHGACSPRIALEGTADLIPIEVWGRNPTIEGMTLAPGFVTHITKEVKILVQHDSTLDLLYLVEKLVQA